MTETAIQPIIPIASIPQFALVTIPAGRFEMGSDADSDSQPLTQIRFANDFYMGQYTVTQQLWAAVMQDNPSYFKGHRRPVERVSWDAICGPNGFLERLNGLKEIQQWLGRQRLSGWAFALPSEAQWEYAARGGQEGATAALAYAGSNDINEVAWYDDNSHGETKPVGLKAPNQLGLYDMSGNVWEWCADDWLGDYAGMPTDGRPQIKKPNRADFRVIRGGSYFYHAVGCRSAFRHCNGPGGSNFNLGFRLVLSPSSVGSL